MPVCSSRSGRDGRTMPALVSVASVCDLVLTVVATCPGSDMLRIQSSFGEAQPHRGLAGLDEGPDVARAAGVEEHVPLAHRGLLGQQPGVEQGLPGRLRERAVVAREAAGEV